MSRSPSDKKPAGCLKVLLRNKNARPENFVESTIQAGIELRGSEVKSLPEARPREGTARPVQGQAASRQAGHRARARGEARDRARDGDAATVARATGNREPPRESNPHGLFRSLTLVLAVVHARAPTVAAPW